MWRTWKRASIGKVNTTLVKRRKYWIYTTNYQIWITKFLQLPSPTTGRVHNNYTRRASLVEKELFALPEHLSSPHVFSGVRVTRSLVLYVCFVDRCLLLLYFFFWPLCSVLLRYTDFDYPSGIFKLFLWLESSLEALSSVLFITLKLGTSNSYNTVFRVKQSNAKREFV